MEKMLLQYDKNKGAWGVKKKPYVTIEIETEEDFNFIQEAVKKQRPMKPLNKKLETYSGLSHQFQCPNCLEYTYHFKWVAHCDKCGQKLDWGEE